MAQTAREMAAAGWPWGARPVDVAAVHLVKRMGILRLAPDSDAPPIHINPWVVPILSGQIRLQKPPLPYWAAAILYRIAGVSEATSRIIPAALGALATLLIFDLARLLYGRRVAWMASILWVTTYIVIEDYRLAMADPYLAFFTLGAVWAWVRASIISDDGTGEATQDKPGEKLRVPFIRRRTPLLMAFYAALALGALAKGPLIFLHVAIPIVLYHLCFGARLPKGLIGHVLGVVVFVAIAFPWPLAVLRQVPNARTLWWYESAGEITGENLENVRGWWFYLMELPQLALPWVALWLFSLAYPLLRRRGRAFFPVGWYATIVLAFSFVGQKKDPYLLPMLPAEALMIAIAAVPLLRIARRRQMHGLPGAVVAAQVLIGIGWAAALPVLMWPMHRSHLAVALLCGLTMLIALFPLREMFAARPVHWFAYQAGAYAAVLLVFCHLVRTPMENARSPAPISRELLAMADGTHTAILESKLPEEIAFYLPLHPPCGVAPSNYLVVIDDRGGVARRSINGHAPPEVKTSDFEGWVPDATLAAVRRVEMKSAPGDARWKVYELEVKRTGFAHAWESLTPELAIGR